MSRRPFGLLISWATPETSTPSAAILSAWMSCCWFLRSSCSVCLRSAISRVSSAVRSATPLRSILDQIAIPPRSTTSGTTTIAPYR